MKELEFDVVDENGKGWYRLSTIADKVNELVREVNKLIEENNNGR